MYGVRKCSSFILLHVAVKFSQRYLLMKLFVSLYILASFVKDKVPIGAWVYLWAFCLVPLSPDLFVCLLFLTRTLDKSCIIFHLYSLCRQKAFFS